MAAKVVGAQCTSSTRRYNNATDLLDQSHLFQNSGRTHLRKAFREPDVLPDRYGLVRTFCRTTADSDARIARSLVTINMPAAN
jgi:hypothetical protein